MLEVFKQSNGEEFLFPTVFRKQGENILRNLLKQPTEKVEQVVVADFEGRLRKCEELRAQEKWGELQEEHIRLYKEFKGAEEKQEILLRIAWTYEQMEDYDKAEKTYLKCTAFDNAQAFLGLGMMNLHIKKIPQGIENIEKANCLSRLDAAIENKLVYAYSLLPETLEKALMLAHTILKRNPESLPTLLMIAEVLRKQRHIDQAIEVALVIDAHRPADFVKHYLGSLYLEQGAIEKAFASFKEALRLTPDYTASVIEIATIVSEVSAEKAIAMFEKVLEKEPSNVLALTRLAKVYESHYEDYEEAIGYYRRAMEVGDDIEPFIKIADCHWKQGMLAMALSEYAEGLERRAHHSLHWKMALIHEQRQDLESALVSASHALKSLGKSEVTVRKDYLRKYAELSLAAGKFEEAIATIDELLPFEESGTLLKMQAEAYFGKKNYDCALDCYERANSLRGDSEEVDVSTLESMASCFDCKEEYLASRLLYEKILKVEPEHKKALNNLANIYLMLGECHLGFELFEKLLTLIPDNVQKRMQLADVYASVGDWSKVEAHLVKCYHLDSKHPLILERLLRLYKEKRDARMVAKIEKKIALLQARKNRFNKKEAPAE